MTPTPHELPALFRKKPVVVEAVQYPCEHPALRRCDCDPDQAKFAGGPCPPQACSECGHEFIETLEGRMRVSPCDWIIKGVHGEFYPCKPDIFAATYEPAEASLARAGAEAVAWMWTHPDGDSGSWRDREPDYEERVRADGCAIHYAYTAPPAAAGVPEGWVLATQDLMDELRYFIDHASEEQRFTAGRGRTVRAGDFDDLVKAFEESLNTAPQPSEAAQEVYRCDYCGSDYTTVACCKSRYEYLTAHGVNIEPPAHPLEQRAREDEWPLLRRMEKIASYAEVKFVEIHSSAGLQPTHITYVPETIREAIAALTQPQAGVVVDEAMVERAAATLYEEATGEPWTVAGVVHDGPDRTYYREHARTVLQAALAGGEK